MTRILLLILMMPTLATIAAAQTPVTSVFTYQGELAEGGTAVDGPVDLMFLLFDAEIGGAAIGLPIQMDSVTVAEGVFAVDLDFGGAPFTGDSRWLEIHVRAPHDPGDGGPFTELDPRQRITAAPYATHALNAKNYWSESGSKIFNDSASFVGVGRDNQVTAAEVFGVKSGASSGYGGMYISTEGAAGLPFYGYAPAGIAAAWHYYDVDGGTWYLNNGGDRLAVLSNGTVGINTSFPTQRLDVNGKVRAREGIEFPDGSLQTSAASPGADGHSLDSEDGGIVDALLVDVDGNVGIGWTPSARLDIYKESSDGNVASVYRDQGSAAAQDVLQIVNGFGSDPNSQLIEAQESSNIRFRVWTDGNVTADGAITGGGADFAEIVKVEAGASSVEPGDVLVIDRNSRRGFARSTRARSTLVSGVYSTQPGVLASNRDWDELERERSSWNGAGEQPSTPVLELARQIDEIPLAVVGIVPCKVSAENGPIAAGDLLVTAATPGHAMRGSELGFGMVLGKALESHASGTGLIEIMVTLQ